MTSGLIRLARRSDAADIARIHRSARLAAMPWLPDLHTPEEDLAFFSEEVLSNQTVLVFEDGGRVVGFIAFTPNWVHHLYIAPDHWARGCGSELLGLAQAGSVRLQLWAFQGNHRARRFYAKHGFQEVELTDGAGNQEKKPDVRLVWKAAASV